MSSPDVIVVGGGIAGLASTFHLSRAGARVRLLERESLLASHSSGRNAAIFRTLDASPQVTALAERSRVLLEALFAARETPWLKRTGTYFVAQHPRALEPLQALARAQGVEHRQVEQPELQVRLPALSGGSATCGLEVPGDGVIDIHAVCSALAEESRRAGAVLTTRAEVARVRVEGGAAAGVVLADGQTIRSRTVLVAAGAWAAGVGQTAGAPLPLAPMRRHIALLERPGELGAEAPVVWCLDDETYFRPESGGLLCSPCDEDPFHPCLPPESPRALELLAEKLARVAPRLAQLGVRRSWACLRTFAPDRAMVAGADPRVAGLFWLAALGGHGMTAGVAAGELAAAAILGRPEPVPRALLPGRLLGGPPPDVESRVDASRAQAPSAPAAALPRAVISGS